MSYINSRQESIWYGSYLTSHPTNNQAGILKNLRREIHENITLICTICAALFSLHTSTSQAALVGVLPATPGGTDYQAYYDTEADLTWLTNANAGFGSEYDAFIICCGSPSGVMTWENATRWIASLNINGVTGWRLPYTPDIDPTCDQPFGGPSLMNCTGSEMGNLYYNVLGGVAGGNINTTHNANYDLFSNIQPGYYWSTEAAWNAPYSVWAFGFANCGGCEDAEAEKAENGGNGGALYVWPVHSGNAGAVPVPVAVWLFSSGLLGLVGIARRKKPA